MLRGFLAVELDAALRLIVFHIPVDIDHAGGLFDVANLPPDLELAVLRVAIDLWPVGSSAAV